MNKLGTVVIALLVCFFGKATVHAASTSMSANIAFADSSSVSVDISQQNQPPINYNINTINNEFEYSKFIVSNIAVFAVPSQAYLINTNCSKNMQCSFQDKFFTKDIRNTIRISNSVSDASTPSKLALSSINTQSYFFETGNTVINQIQVDSYKQNNTIDVLVVYL